MSEHQASDETTVGTHMHAGSRLGEHRTDWRMSIQVLSGNVSVHLPGRSYAVRAGHLLALDESIPRDVEALEPSTVLLTLAREQSEADGEAH